MTNSSLARVRFLVLVCTLANFNSASASDLFVSPHGNDAGSGSRDRPFLTLQAAQKAARNVKGGPVTIQLLPGTHYLTEPLVLTAEDSGTAAAPVIWRGDEGKVIVSGGRRLDLKWEEYKRPIVQAKVPVGLITDQLFVNGRRQILARYPNFDPKIDIYNGYAADCISRERAANWSDPAGGFMHAMHQGQWGGFSYRILGKDDQNNVKYEGGWQGNRPSSPHAKLRFVENIFEELDAPGEWFLNSKTSTLYFYPPKDLDLARATIEVPRLKHLMEVHGTKEAPVRFVEFRGITFRHALRTFMETKEPLLRSDWTIYRGGAALFDGAEDCALQDCYFDQVGGNAVFVNNFNRRVAIKGCRIEEAGASGVVFVGDPAAVRNPLTNVGRGHKLADIDRTPGPRTDNYPADCQVSNCLISRIGRFEKQSAGVSIHMSARITINHCSIYDVPRAGINIGDGCWGGDIIEYCDVFDTVKETGDHGSFNSWGRDRYWGINGADLNAILLGKDKDIPLLDCIEPNTLRNNRWRCDHGWDIDLDDGSSNYRIYNNLCLHGGLKNREGFNRLVENNIMVGNSFHPHVWYKNSGDVFRHNIVFTPYRPIGVPTPWGEEVDYNLFHAAGFKGSTAAKELQNASRRDEHSIRADALFINPEAGDFRVKANSPAIALGFKNFTMDDFGVQKPALKALARAPFGRFEEAKKPGRSDAIHTWQGIKLRNIVGEGEMSVYGTPGETGILVLDLPKDHPFAKAGLQSNDVIIGVGAKSAPDFDEFDKEIQAAKAATVKLKVLRKQNEMTIEAPTGK